MTDKEVEKLHTAWEKSGLSISAFCKKNDIPRYIFGNYRRKHGLASRRLRRSNTELKQVHVKFLKSGLTIKKFCKENGIDPACLYNYRARQSLTNLRSSGDVSPKKSVTPARVEKLAQARKNAAHDFLTKAATHLKDRATTYDNQSGERSIGKTVEMFNTLTGSNMTEEQGWKFMALLKLVRSEQGKYRADSYEDGAAYIALAGETASKNQK